MALQVGDTMLCELCGSEAKFLKDVKIEGSVLKVCPGCAPMGTEPTERERLGVKGYVNQQLQKRARRMTTRSPFEGTKELAPDYAARIRKGREKLGWDHETLAHNLNEKKNLITKVESGSFHPPDKLVKKLERKLNIKLMEAVEEDTPVGQAPGAGLTLGDLITQARKGQD